MAEALETVGDWVNDAREWFSEQIVIDEWIDGFEEWLQEEAETVFSWISEKLEWSLEALQNGFIDGEPPVVGLLFVIVAFGFALRSLGRPISPLRGVLVTLVALPVLLWAHDGDIRVALIGATVALVAVMVRDHEEPFDPLARAAVILGPAVAIVLRGNFVAEDASTAAVGTVAVPAVLVGLVTLVLAFTRGTPKRDVVLAVPATLTLVLAALTTDWLVGGLALAAAALTAVVALLQWQFRGFPSSFPLDGLYLAALTSLLYLWGDLEVMAAVTGALMVPLVVALAVGRPTDARTFPVGHVLRGLAWAIGGLVVVEALARLARITYENVEFGNAPFRLEVLRPLAATTEFWESAEFLRAAGAVVAGVLLVTLLVLALGVSAMHAVALSGLAVAGFLLDDPLYLAVALAALAWEVRSFKFGLVAGFGLVLIDVMGLWEDAMENLSLVLVAALLAVCIGVPIGIAATQSSGVSRLVRPVLDLMQTMPAFVYLIPAVVLFGIGAVPGVVATVIFAMPPAVRLTELGIRQVDEEVVEAGEAFGTAPSRILSRIQIPLAMPTILAGINQVIMLSLSMVVLAAIVGAGGLGGEVLLAVQRQETGDGVEAGLGVVVLAIFLDRITQALGQRTGPRTGDADAS